MQCRPDIDDVVTVLEDLNECLNGTPDASMLMRNASLKRVTKGSYKNGFAAPASLIKQAAASAASAAERQGRWPQGGRGARASQPAAGTASRIILEMIKSSGLDRDADLKKRLDVTGAQELIRIAGLAPSRVPSRVKSRAGPPASASTGAATGEFTPRIQLVPEGLGQDSSTGGLSSDRLEGISKAYADASKVMLTGRGIRGGR
jgi:hypothetical protein